MKIFKIRKVGSEKFLDIKNLSESNAGTTYKQLSAARKNAEFISNYYRNDNIEIVEFELIQKEIHNL